MNKLNIFLRLQGFGQPPIICLYIYIYICTLSLSDSAAPSVLAKALLLEEPLNSPNRLVDSNGKWPGTHPDLQFNCEPLEVQEMQKKKHSKINTLYNKDLHLYKNTNNHVYK